MYRLFTFRSQISNGPQVISIKNSLLPKVMNCSNISSNIYYLLWYDIKINFILFYLIKVVCVYAFDLRPQKVYKIKH